jgi:hypothetical protein
MYQTTGPVVPLQVGIDFVPVAVVAAPAEVPQASASIAAPLSSFCTSFPSFAVFRSVLGSLFPKSEPQKRWPLATRLLGSDVR